MLGCFVPFELKIPIDDVIDTAISISSISNLTFDRDINIDAKHQNIQED